MGGFSHFSHGTTSARGIAIFMKKEMKEKITNLAIDNQGRLIIFNLEENNEKLTIAAIYAPNRDCPQFFENIRENLRHRHEKIIIIGDFNLTLNVSLDRKNTYHNNNNSKEKLEDIMDELCLKDIWRAQNESDTQCSWYKNNKLDTGSRIDYALVSNGLDQKIKNATYISGHQTDHRAFYMVVDLKYQERGKGYWKFNTLLRYVLE